jgi:hypothetical protein
MSFAFGRPSCGRALRCVGAPNLRTCLVLHLGTHLADVPCIELGCPTLVSSSFSLVLPCVDVFVSDRFFIWAPILRTRLTLRLGAHLADVPLSLRSSAQLADVRTCLAFALWKCIGAANLRMCLVLHWGAQLSDVSCVAFGCPSCGRALRCVGAPNLGRAVLKTLPPSQKNFLSILQLVFKPSAPLCGRFRCG